MMDGKMIPSTLKRDEQYKTFDKEHMEKRVYTVAEVQDILGVSNTTVYRLMKKGAFRGVHIGSVVRISKKSFDKWISEQI